MNDKAREHGYENHPTVIGIRAATELDSVIDFACQVAETDCEEAILEEAVRRAYWLGGEDEHQHEDY